ncbi:hypothetical protein [Bradyrhizobium cenepequi]|uniref:hypothetical protein n=1 Tax=Bradyrhizobium cenepequi TaxID=2821403 RepID=UPI001CE2A102|nr:hypothetical protein [Bradyrhizobium cenepequi]MCA6111138.1 hypothetical protein [Bradyrhizobium cenepequi]
MKVIAAANAFADADPDIAAIDRRKVVFCSIEDLEEILSETDEAGFLATLSAAAEEKFDGWLLSSVHRELVEQAGKEQSTRRFPFDLGDVLPWWSMIAALRAERGAAIAPASQDVGEQ